MRPDELFLLQLVGLQILLWSMDHEEHLPIWLRFPRPFSSRERAFSPRVFLDGFSVTLNMTSREDKCPAPLGMGGLPLPLTLISTYSIIIRVHCYSVNKFQFHSRRIQPKHQKMPRRFFLLGQPINCLGLGRLRLSTIIFNILSTSGDSKAVRRLSFQRSVQF